MRHASDYAVVLAQCEGIVTKNAVDGVAVVLICSRRGAEDTEWVWARGISKLSASAL